ncbi:unnamed protein product, partial [marine sediment metagenome]
NTLRSRIDDYTKERLAGIAGVIRHRNTTNTIKEVGGNTIFNEKK